MVKGIIHQPFELEDGNVFYAFSYYYDRAVDAGLIGEHTLTRPLRNYTAHLLGCYYQFKCSTEAGQHESSTPVSMDLTSYRFVVVREMVIRCQLELKGRTLYC